MKHYAVLSKQRYDADSYYVTSLRFEDMADIKNWRNEQIDVLRQKQILTDEDQVRYFEQVVKPSMSKPQPPLILFSYFHHDKFIGYGGLTNMDWTHLRAEISFLVATERTRDEDLYASDFRYFLELMKHIAFLELNFNRLFTETFDIRPHHVAILESAGFRFEGRMRQHVNIEGRYVDSLLHGYLKEFYDAERNQNLR